MGEITNRKFGALSSSINPEQLSATVSGAILSVAGLIVFGAHYLGFPLADNQVSDFAQQAGISIGFLWMCFGLVRKFVVFVHQKFFA